MRKWLIGAFTVGVAVAACGQADKAAAQAWTWSYASDPQFVTWNANRGYPNSIAGTGRGSQFYLPIAAAVTGSPYQDWKFEAVGHGGYVYASQNVGPFSGWVSTATDTQLSGTATYKGFNGWQPFFTLMTNLPTGESQLVGSHTFARMDPDLVPIAVYGEGFNLGPTIGATIPINAQTAAVFSGGYTWRGKYWKEGGFTATGTTTAALDDKPSNVWTGAASVIWSDGRLTLQGTASFATETANYVNSIIAYRNGNRTTLSGSGSYEWDNWTTSVDGYYVHLNHNDIPVGIVAPGVLTQEALDSNNNIFRINAAQMYKTSYYNGALSIGPVGSFMLREHNSWDPTVAFFVAGKTRYSAGGAAVYAPSDAYNLTARVEHIWINQDAQLTPVIPSFSGDGWFAMLAFTYNTH